MINAAIGQMKIVPGAVSLNLQNAQKMVDQASALGAELLVLPGWCLSGKWRKNTSLSMQRELHLQCVEAGMELAKYDPNITVVFGNMQIDDFSSAIWVGQGGKFSVHAPGKALSLEMGKRSLRVGLSVGEAVGDPTVDLMVVCGGDPYFRQNESPRQKWAKIAQQNDCAVLYANGVGLQNCGDKMYALLGCSAAVERGGKLVYKLPPDQEQCSLVTWHSPSATTVTPKSEMSLTLFALRRVIADYMEQSSLRKVVVGASGGIDSAVVAALMVHVCGPENVLLISMPSAYNSATTQSLARKLAQNLGCYFATVGIDQSVALTQEQISGLEIKNAAGATQNLKLSDFHLENVQARDRSGRILAAAAAAWGAVFTCNANKVEATVGYSTLYGDHGGFIAPLGDLWKHEVYALGRYLNHIFASEVMPEGVFNIKPSAELSPQQNPEKGGGDPFHYWYHDQLLAAFTEKGLGPTALKEAYQKGHLKALLNLDRPVEELFASAEEFEADLQHWWRQYTGPGAFKRVQAPPVITVALPPKLLRLK